MKLQVLQSSMSKVLQIAARFASTRAQLPVLNNIKLAAYANKIEVSATNLETSINITLGAKVEEEGEITIPAKTIADVVSNLGDRQLTLIAEKEQLNISTDNFSSRIVGMNTSDFPDIPKETGENPFKINRDALIKALDKVLFATSTDETRPLLTGVYFNIGTSLTLVATDGFRLSEKVTGIDNSKEKEDIILPKNVLSELGRLSSGEETILMKYDKDNSQVVFGVGNIVLASRILSGEFPDYKKRIPDKSKIRVNTDKMEIVRAIKLASVFAREGANIVKLGVKGGSLEVSAESSSAGKQVTQIDAQVEGGELEIAFNYRFVEEFLNSIEGEDVLIELNDAASPGVFKDPSDKDYLHLIMPLKLQG